MSGNPPIRNGLHAATVPVAIISQLTSSTSQSDLDAEDLLDSGNNAYTSGNFQGAEEKWLDARKCHRSSNAWPKAVFNLGLLEMDMKNYLQSIAYFDEVLQSHPNDKEPGESIMQVYRNYSHRSALEISVCFENMGNYPQALHYARLAKTRYPNHSWCGTCLNTANFTLNTRIAYLCGRVYGLPSLAVVAMGLILSLLVPRRPGS